MARTPFPDDLVLTQLRVLLAYEALARPSRTGCTTLRRALIRELRALYSHPYWTDGLHSYADLVELRREARARVWVEAA
ncbi:hypothetical protein LG634_16895 [Streptomyces bambusae]|uniref:hypothetical protein n=1 Tax=Streptomyces bambusae TaxID=1550616 RepID=UPI001CFF5446|nr:hypothetical protein [Streptomyces bambusae]MCB5166510.1 hypothetical protein [Streptomyces bambusae]